MSVVGRISVPTDERAIVYAQHETSCLAIANRRIKRIDIKIERLRFAVGYGSENTEINGICYRIAGRTRRVYAIQMHIDFA